MNLDQIKQAEELINLCQKWEISRLSIFGSFAQNTQKASSDVDLLVGFSSNARWSLLDHVRMKREFETFFGRNVDIITESALNRMKNPNRKKDISDQLKVIYAA